MMTAANDGASLAQFDGCQHLYPYLDLQVEERGGIIKYKVDANWGDPNGLPST